MKIKILTSLIVAYTSNSLFELYSIENLIGFFLALSIGLGGKIGYDSRTKSISGIYVFRRFLIALMVCFIIDLLAYDREFSATSRIALVCLSAFLSELILTYIIDNHKSIFKRIFRK